MLESLHIRLVSEQDGALCFEAPLFRHDLWLEADLIEEIGRLSGYDNIPQAETATVLMTRPADPTARTVDTIRKALAYAGLHETTTNSMCSEKWRALLTPDTEPVVVLNPLSPEMAQMRTTLLGALLQVASYNLNRKNTDNRMFEVAKTFASRGLKDLPDERDVVAVLLEGNYEPAWWQNGVREADFYILKAVLGSLARHCHAGRVEYAPPGAGPSYFGPENAGMRWDNGVTGACGRIRQDICAAFDIATPVYYAELDVTGLIAAKPATPSYSSLPRHPAVERDFCFVISESLPSSVIADEIAAISELVEQVEPFDVYRGEKLGKGRKSIAYAVRLRAAERTLTDGEAEKVCGRIIGVVREKYGAELRS
jgi:phenylalanyl-tRNA synthetase beta chain